jgi:nucleotidyltransferase/DNA polymerase involved in DNA repair
VPVVTRTILHVDMDAFYTSVEQRDHPEYRGKPVIVGADPRQGRGRGVVAAASYEARRFGVRSAMPISRAWRACPQGIYLRGNMEKYAEVSGRIMEILGSYTDLVEPLSIDEAFLDVSAICLPERGRALASEIKETIWKKEGLRASIGVAPNKFLAKIASDLEKPDGLVVVATGAELEFLRDLPIERLWGVGPKTAEPLRRAGFLRIGDLWGLSTSDPRMDSTGLSGRNGEHLLLLARGIDDRPVVPHHEPKSIGHETTFAVDIEDPEQVRKTLLALSDAVAVRLRKHELEGKTVTLKFRDASFATETRAQTLSLPVADGASIFEAALGLIERIRWKGRKVRLLGVSVSGLSKAGEAGQLSLFDRPEKTVKNEKLGRARDALEARFGKGTISRASFLAAGPEAPSSPRGSGESEP